MDRKKSLVIGPRTHKDILKGRNIRKHEDGGDVFEDYWTDSDGESSCHSKKSDYFSKRPQKHPSIDSHIPTEVENEENIAELENESLSKNNENSALRENDENSSVSSNEENAAASENEENVAASENEGNVAVNEDEENVVVNEDEENLAVHENEENVTVNKNEENAVENKNEEKVIEKQNVIGTEDNKNIAETNEAILSAASEEATYILKPCNEHTNQLKQNSETSFQTQENLLDETVTIECVSQHNKTKEVPKTTHAEFYKDTQECTNESALSKTYTRKDAHMSENGQKNSKKSALMMKNKKALEMEEIFSRYDEYDAKIMQMIHQENDSGRNVHRSSVSSKKVSSTQLSIFGERKQTGLNTCEGNEPENSKNSPSNNKRRISNLHNNSIDNDVDRNVHNSPISSKTVSQIPIFGEKRRTRSNISKENILQNNRDSPSHSKKRISRFHNNAIDEDFDPNVHKSPISSKVSSTQPPILSERKQTRLSTQLQNFAKKKQTRSITCIQNEFKNNKNSAKSKNHHDDSCKFCMLDSQELAKNNSEKYEKNTIKNVSKSKNFGKKNKVIEIINNVSSSLDVSLSKTMTKSKTIANKKHNIVHSKLSDHPSYVQNENVTREQAKRNLHNSLGVDHSEHSFESDTEMNEHVITSESSTVRQKIAANEESSPLKCSVKNVSRASEDTNSQTIKKQKTVSDKKYMPNNHSDQDVPKKEETHISKTTKKQKMTANKKDSSTISSKTVSSSQPILPGKRQIRSNTSLESDTEMNDHVISSKSSTVTQIIAANEQNSPLKSSVKNVSRASEDTDSQTIKTQTVADKKYMPNNRSDQDVSKEKEIHISKATKKQETAANKKNSSTISSKTISSSQTVLEKKQTRSNTSKKEKPEVSKNTPCHNNKRTSKLCNNIINDDFEGNMDISPISSKKVSPTQLPVHAEKKQSIPNICNENESENSRKTVTSGFHSAYEFCTVESPRLLKKNSIQSVQKLKDTGKKSKVVESFSLDDVSLSKSKTVASKRKSILRNKHLSHVQKEKNITLKAKERLDNSLIVDPSEHLFESNTEMNEATKSPRTRQKISANIQSSPAKRSLDFSGGNGENHSQTTEEQEKDVNEKNSNIKHLGENDSKKRKFHISKTAEKQKRTAKKKKNPSTLPIDISEVADVTVSQMQVTINKTTAVEEYSLMEQGQDFDKNHSSESETNKDVSDIVQDDLLTKSQKKKKSLHSKGQPNSTDPPRRSNRQRYAPLARWRNERILYRFEGDDIKVLGIDSGTKEDDGALKGIWHSISTKKRKIHENTKPPKKAKLIDVGDKKSFYIHLHKKFPLIPWTTASGVPNENSNEYLIKRMIETPKNAFGFLEIRSGKEKPPQYMPEEDLQLTVITGEVEITVQENIYKLNDKDMFIVPSNTAYSIKNVGMKKALLAFVVGRFKYLHC